MRNFRFKSQPYQNLESGGTMCPPARATQDQKSPGQLGFRSFSVLYEYHKGFKVKDAMKNAGDGIVTALRFILKLSRSFDLIH